MCHVLQHVAVKRTYSTYVYDVRMRNNNAMIVVLVDMTRITVALAEHVLTDAGWTRTSLDVDTQTWSYTVGDTHKSVTFPRSGMTELSLILN